MDPKKEAIRVLEVITKVLEQEKKKHQQFLKQRRQNNENNSGLSIVSPNV